MNSLKELQDKLKLMAYRATALCGQTVDGRPLGKATAEFLDTLLTDTGDPEKQRLRAEFLARAENDPVTRNQLCALRTEQFTNYISASQNIIPFFFDIVNLKDDEMPIAQNLTPEQRNTVSYIGEDGSPKTLKISRDDVEVPIYMRWLATKEVRYKKIDLYRGNIVDAALSTINLAYDMANQEEVLAWTLIQTAFKPFVFTGKRATHSYVLGNPRVIKANLPTTNDVIVPTGSGSNATKFGYRVLKAISRYASLWGAVSPQPFLPTGRILIPAVDASDIADEIVPAGFTNNPVADQLLTMGWMRINYLGPDWILIPDATLASGTCYPEFNKKIGRIFNKPGLAVERIRSDYETDKKNEELRYMKKPFGTYYNEVDRLHIARFTYNV